MAGILRERSVESSTSAAPLECVTARMRGGGVVVVLLVEGSLSAVAIRNAATRVLPFGYG